MRFVIHFTMAQKKTRFEIKVERETTWEGKLVQVQDVWEEFKKEEAFSDSQKFPRAKNGHTLNAAVLL